MRCEANGGQDEQYEPATFAVLCRVLAFLY